MRRNISHTLSFVMAVLCAGALLQAHGAGFVLYEASARGNAMGGALVGATGDASANYYNPANMTALECTHLMAGVTLIHPALDVTVGGDKNNLDSGVFSLRTFMRRSSWPTAGLREWVCTASSAWEPNMTATGR